MSKQSNLLNEKIAKTITAPKNYSKKYRESLRDKAFLIFGNKCSRCGENNFLVLTIDHIKPIGKKRKNICSIYSEIIRFPIKSKNKYQLLCRNCNWKKCIQNNERNVEEEPMKPHIQQLYKMVRANTKAIKQLHIEDQTPKRNVEIEALLLPHVKLFTNIDGRIDKELMRIVAEEQCNVYIGYNRAYNIAKRLRYHNPTKFAGES